jgi:pyruvate kinase
MKLVFTLGPASEELTLIQSMCQVADCFRLNVAHLTLDGLQQWLNKLAVIFQAQHQVLPVILDLQGAKMRIGQYPSLDKIPEHIRLFLGDLSESASELPVPHSDLFRVLQVGDILSLNDDRLKIQVTDVATDEAKAKVLVNGELSSGKGINRVQHPVPFTEVLDRDQAAINLGLNYPFVEFACSFILDGTESKLLRPFTQDRKLIAKIERPESMAFLPQIDRNFDELWLCRGDLGAQAGLKALGQLQSEFVAQFDQFSKPKLIAGQVLEYMTHFPTPTRSEVVHLYDIQKIGFDGLVLSDETAIGQYPQKVAEFLADFFHINSGS